MRLLVLLAALAGFQQPACAHWRQIEGFGAQPVAVARTRRALRAEGELANADREHDPAQHTLALSVAVRRLLDAEEEAPPPDEEPESTSAVADPAGEPDVPVENDPPEEDPPDLEPPPTPPPSNTTAPPPPTPEPTPDAPPPEPTPEPTPETPDEPGVLPDTCCGAGVDCALNGRSG